MRVLCSQKQAFAEIFLFAGCSSQFFALRRDNMRIFLKILIFHKKYHTFALLNKNTTMEYTFRYTKNADGWYSGQCEEVPEAISQAPTLRELKENMVDAIELVFQCRKYKL